jgi:hypothetical protein
MPLVTRTVIVYIDDELVEIEIEVEEDVNKNICRLCEKVELAEDNDIICPECWLTVEPVDPCEHKNENEEDDTMSYRSFKEMVRQRNQSEISDISVVSISPEESWDKVLDKVVGGEVPDCDKCGKSVKNIEYYCELSKKGNGFKGDVYAFSSVCQECREELKDIWNKGADERYAVREKERLEYINRSYEYNPDLDVSYNEREYKEWVCENCKVDGTAPYYLELCADCCRKLHPDHDKKDYSEMLGYMFSQNGSQCERIEMMHELNARFVSDVANNVFESSEAMMRAIAKLIQKAPIMK